MTLAVMTRATLGHTGQQLHASVATQAIFAAIVVAALARICAVIDPGYGDDCCISPRWPGSPPSRALPLPTDRCSRAVAAPRCPHAPASIHRVSSVGLSARRVPLLLPASATPDFEFRCVISVAL